MKIGWISVYRKIQSSWLWEDKPFSKGQAWIDILLECNHSEKKVLIGNELLLVKRGESINSLDTWAKRWGWHRSAVRRFLILLETETMIERKTAHNTTHLSVVNYDTYQMKENEFETNLKQSRNESETNLTTNNNINNEINNEINKERNIYRKFGHLKLTVNEFEKLSEIYTQQEIDDILDDIENYKKNTQYKSLYLTAKKWLKKREDKVEDKNEGLNRRKDGSIIPTPWMR